jgi:hypothetical protein
VKKFRRSEKILGVIIMSTWMDHVKATRAANPGISYKEALSAASATWVKGSGTATKRGVNTRTKVLGPGKARAGPLRSAGGACKPLPRGDCSKHPRCAWRVKSNVCAKKPDGKTRVGGGQYGGAGTWMDHVKATRAANPGISYKEALSAASATWVKGSGTATKRGVNTRTKVLGPGKARAGPLRSAGGACKPLPRGDCSKHPRCAWRAKSNVCAKKPDGKTRVAQTAGYWW